jgi:hypothetical protein
MITEQAAQFLTSSASASLLKEAECYRQDGYDELKSITRLRKKTVPEFAFAIWELTELRHRARRKFGEHDASRLFFDRDGYEMASSLGLSSLHASLLESAGADSVFEPCAGVGIDSLRIAMCGIDVWACELDPVRAVFARANAAAFGLANVHVACADALSSPLPPGAQFAFFDPARRSGRRRRIVDGDDLFPPLSYCQTLIGQGVSSILVKLSPAAPHELAGEYGGSLEYISEGGECKEALLKIGTLCNSDAVSARLLDSGVLVAQTGYAAKIDNRIGSILYEPDPAVIRAGLVQRVAEEADGWLIDPQIAYVLSDRLIETPLAAAYHVRASLPFHIKHLQDELRRREIGRVVIKKRGFPQEPDEIRKQLKLTGSKEGIVILTRIENRLIAMIADAA